MAAADINPLEMRYAPVACGDRHVFHLEVHAVFDFGEDAAVHRAELELDGDDVALFVIPGLVTMRNTVMVVVD